ncbi:MAG: hypothetical protein JO340_08470 [Acidobacteriaceae bacterium]|nr:hypothetical protein [Acidobacteriaceae bacterium]
MGQEHGLGYDGLADDRPRIQAPRSLLDIAKPEAPVQQPHRSIALQLRWESALPIRLAQLKSAGPAFETADAYTLAVYGIPRVHAYIAPNSLSASLASQAVLRRGAKPAVRPSRVEVIQRDDDTAVLYYFPLAAEISRNDRRVTFEAQIGRIAIVQFFTLEEMLFQGKLEL